jgi:hypothetical protein
MPSEPVTRPPAAAARRPARSRAADPRDDFWAGIIRHRDRVRTFSRPVKTAPAAKDPQKQRRMTA